MTSLPPVRPFPPGWSYALFPSARPGDPISLGLALKLNSADGSYDVALLRDRLDSRVYLGCLVDGRGQLCKWLEVWVQTVGRLAELPGTTRDQLGNAMLDERWHNQVQAFVAMPGCDWLATGWEETPTPPLFIAAPGKTARPLTGADAGCAYVLCRDDRLLEAADLPAYATTLDRYLHLPPLGADSPFVPVTPDSPRPADGQTLAEVAEAMGEGLVFNPEGGLMLVRGVEELALEEWIDALYDTQAPLPVPGMPRIVRETLPYNEEPTLDTDGWLFHERISPAGLALELLYLRLRMLADAVQSVKRMTAATQQPLLNLTADSFAVTLGPRTSGLPHWWESRLQLIDPGAALPTQVSVNGLDYYTSSAASETSVYFPEEAGRPVVGVGTIRVRQWTEEGPSPEARCMLEGTLTTQELITCGENLLLWARLNLRGEAHDLIGYLQPQTLLGAGEYRFTTAPTVYPPRIRALLQQSEGTSFSRSVFRVIPLLSSPCDLYSLGVLGVRLVLVGPGLTLAKTIDELHSLIHQLTMGYQDDIPLAQRIRDCLQTQPRLLAALGPRQANAAGMALPGNAEVLPETMWYDLLALIVGMFPSAGQDCVCNGFGNLRPGRLERVYEPTQESLAILLGECRSLMFVDWRANREIHAAIATMTRGE